MSASWPNTATVCHSVRSWRSPVCLSFQRSDVATRIFATLSPLWKVLISGSAPRRPISVTLFSDILCVPFKNNHFFLRREPSRNDGKPHFINVRIVGGKFGNRRAQVRMNAAQGGENFGRHLHF